MTPLPLDPDHDPHPVAWSRICPVVLAELRAIWWRLRGRGVPLPHREILFPGGRS